MKRSDIDRMTLFVLTWEERQGCSPRASPPTPPPLHLSPKRMTDAAEGGCEAVGNLMQMEKDTSMMTLLASYFA